LSRPRRLYQRRESTPKRKLAQHLLEEVDEGLQRLSAPLGQQEKIYRLSSDQRFKTGSYVSAGIEDQIFVIVFEFFVLLCAYKTPKRDVKFQVLLSLVVLWARSWFIYSL
jgi:hypothetical protein